MATAVAVAVLGTVVGCAGPQPTDSAQLDAEAQEHAGPWADEFAMALEKSESDSEREILADGVVTPTELEQAHDGVRRCLADSGLSITYRREGGFEVGGRDGGSPGMPFEQSNAALEACETRFDAQVTFLFEQTRRNPARLDEATIEVECLVTAGVVEPSYGRKDWEADNETGDFPFDPLSEAAQACDRDPLGLWYER